MREWAVVLLAALLIVDCRVRIADSRFHAKARRTQSRNGGFHAEEAEFWGGLWGDSSQLPIADCPFHAESLSTAEAQTNFA